MQAHGREQEKMTAAVYVIEKSSNLESLMPDNVDSDNAHEHLQHLIVSKITLASQTPSPDSSGQRNQKSH
jgi:hypothetical protein